MRPLCIVVTWYSAVQVRDVLQSCVVTSTPDDLNMTKALVAQLVHLPPKTIINLTKALVARHPFNVGNRLAGAPRKRKEISIPGNIEGVVRKKHPEFKQVSG